MQDSTPPGSRTRPAKVRELIGDIPDTRTTIIHLRGTRSREGHARHAPTNSWEFPRLSLGEVVWPPWAALATGPFGV